MTVSTTENKVIASGNGVTTIFTFPFLVLEASHLKVYTDEGGGLVLRALTTHYSIAGLLNPSGGTVTFVTPPGVTVANNVVIIRDVPLTQLVDYVANDSFPAETHETALDKLTMIVQQLQEQVNRSILSQLNSPLTSVAIPNPTPLTCLQWDASGTILQNTSGNPDSAHADMLLAETFMIGAGNSASAAYASELNAAAYAAGVNLPALGVSKQRLRVNVGGTAMEWGDYWPGEVVQVVSTQDAGVINSTAVIPIDGTIPQNTEGVECFTLAITPRFSTSKLIIEGMVQVGTNDNADAVVALFKNSLADCLTAVHSDDSGTGTPVFTQVVVHYEELAVDTSTRTFKLRFGPDSVGTIYKNANSGGSTIFGSGRMHSYLTATEVAQ